MDKQAEARAEIQKIARRLATHRKGWNAATADAVPAAKAGREAGISEVELAKLFGVDRAGTIRRWLAQ
jgi:hypothetical protein